jgi:hypothetical protein
MGAAQSCVGLAGQAAADPQEGRSDSRRHHNRRDVGDLCDGGTDGPVDRVVEGVTDAVSHDGAPAAAKT